MDRRPHHDGLPGKYVLPAVNVLLILLAMVFRNDFNCVFSALDSKRRGGTSSKDQEN